MQFGINKKDISFIKESLNKYLKTDTTVWVFGSRARGDHQKFSDLDLMIESQEEQKSEIGKLNEIFESSNLTIKIDIVQLKNFAASYKDNYLKDRQLLINIQNTNY